MKTMKIIAALAAVAAMQAIPRILLMCFISYVFLLSFELHCKISAVTWSKRNLFNHSLYLLVENTNK